jgi:hypothetical protein
MGVRAPWAGDVGRDVRNDRRRTHRRVLGRVVHRDLAAHVVADHDLGLVTTVTVAGLVAAMERPNVAAVVMLPPLGHLNAALGARAVRRSPLSRWCRRM